MTKHALVGITLATLLAIFGWLWLSRDGPWRLEAVNSGSRCMALQHSVRQGLPDRQRRSQLP